MGYIKKKILQFDEYITYWFNCLNLPFHLYANDLPIDNLHNAIVAVLNSNFNSVSMWNKSCLVCQLMQINLRLLSFLVVSNYLKFMFGGAKCCVVQLKI